MMLKIILITKIIVKVSYFRNFTKFGLQNPKKYNQTTKIFIHEKNYIIDVVIILFNF